jgi:hypothetical protein
MPVIRFALLFGLSMDHHVFLLSRIKEGYDATGDTAAVARVAAPPPVDGAAARAAGCWAGAGARLNRQADTGCMDSVSGFRRLRHCLRWLSRRMDGTPQVTGGASCRLRSTRSPSRTTESSGAASNATLAERIPPSPSSSRTVTSPSVQVLCEAPGCSPQT